MQSSSYGACEFPVEFFGWKLVVVCGVPGTPAEKRTPKTTTLDFGFGSIFVFTLLHKLL